MISQPVIIWSAIILLMVVAFAVRMIEKMRMSHHLDKQGHLNKHRHHFIEIAKEKELFYCPGDEWFDETVNK